MRRAIEKIHGIVEVVCRQGKPHSRRLEEYERKRLEFRVKVEIDTWIRLGNPRPGPKAR